MGTIRTQDTEIAGGLFCDTSSFLVVTKGTRKKRGEQQRSFPYLNDVGIMISSLRAQPSSWREPLREDQTE